MLCKRHVLMHLCLVLLCACGNDTDVFNGYVEGDFLYLTPTTDGLLQKLSVKRGDRVKAGQELFSLDTTLLSIAHAKAKADLKIAKSTLSDLSKGQRPEELQIIARKKAQAEAALINAEKDYQRYLKLADSKYGSVSSLENATETYETAKAKLEELEAEMNTAKLGARSDQIEGAKASVDRARQDVTETAKNLKDASPNAPADGIVQDTFFNVSEFVKAGEPVVSLLLPEKIKIRFFLSHKDLTRISIGQKVLITYDGQPQPLDGTISFISANAEYTPPVVFSQESREKLVFMVEATPAQWDGKLRPGLAVDVTIVPPIRNVAHADK